MTFIAQFKHLFKHKLFCVEILKYKDKYCVLWGLIAQAFDQCSGEKV